MYSRIATMSRNDDAAHFQIYLRDRKLRGPLWTRICDILRSAEPAYSEGKASRRENRRERTHDQQVRNEHSVSNSQEVDG